MKFGLFAPLANPFSSADYLGSLASAAEARGYSSLWVGEHTVMFDSYESAYPYSPEGKIPQIPGSGVLEPIVALGYLAARTTKIRLGTGICLLAQRNPVYAAKEMATLDFLTGGRMNFGVGVGWLKEEFDAVNVPWAQRGKRTNEYLEVIKTLWCDDPSEYRGSFFNLPSCHMFPKPVQQPHVPIYIGGESDAALKRVAKYGSAWIGFYLAPDEVAARLPVLDEALAIHGRSRKDVTIAICPWTKLTAPEQVDAYASAGVDELVLPVAAYKVEELAGVFDRLAKFSGRPT